MTAFILVPGMCHGAWCFDGLAHSLRSAGHRVLAVTLTGVAERAHLLAGAVNLDTHITDVLAAVEAYAPKDDLVLVGHSYGGMVITGVADRIRERITSMVFVDAVVPQDGEACWDIVDEAEHAWYVKVDNTGFGVPPRAPRCGTPNPLPGQVPQGVGRRTRVRRLSRGEGRKLCIASSSSSAPGDASFDAKHTPHQG